MGLPEGRGAGDPGPHLGLGPARGLGRAVRPVGGPAGEHQPLQEGGSTPHQAESEENPASRMAQVMIRIDKI